MYVGGARDAPPPLGVYARLPFPPGVIRRMRAGVHFTDNLPASPFLSIFSGHVVLVLYRVSHCLRDSVCCPTHPALCVPLENARRGLRSLRANVFDRSALF